MNKKQRNQRISLTLSFSVVIFVIQVVSIAVAAILIYILARAGVFTDPVSGLPGISTMILLMSAVSLLIGIALAFSTSVIPLKPVNRFITQMNRLASGDFSVSLHFGKPLNTHPAFEELSQSFNKMAEDLGRTEMLRADFINNFSHEFKTPIVSIAGFAKLLRRGNLTPEQQQEYLAIIEEESLRLAHMATNVLDLTKLENQSILNGVEEYNLSEQLRSCVLLLENKWSAKKQELQLEFPEVSIRANEEMLKLVWINLLDNAVKFCPESGQISVQIGEREDSLAVSVTNTGSEIPADVRGKIFNKFYQADESHASAGNGVGLAVVKRVADLHGGRVEVQSENMSTTFTVVLPKRP